MGFDPSIVKAICFDVDGTLSDTDDQWVSRYSGVLKPVSFLFPNRRPQDFVRWAVMVSESPANMVYHLLDRFNLDDDVARIYNFLSQHGKDHSPANFWMVEGVRDLLENLHSKYPMAVVSARGASTFRFLDQFALTPFFKTIVISDTCQYTKPYPDPVLWAAGKMGVTPQNCLMVGDTCVDIKAGKAAGAQTAGVLCGFGKEKELRRSGADLIINHTAELASYL